MKEKTTNPKVNYRSEICSYDEGALLLQMNYKEDTEQKSAKLQQLCASKKSI